MSKIIERIQKLLRLAQNAGSEAEAALAAQRAADMMAEHEIHEAELALASEAPRQVEPIEKRFQVTTTKKRVAWHMRITNAVAQTYGAMAYWHSGNVVLFGRLSAVQAASYTSQYLMREVEKLTDKEASAKIYSKSYRNAFRLGCSNRVANRLEEEEEKRKRDAYKAAMAASAPAPSVVTEEDLDDAVEDEIEPESLPPPPDVTPATTMALAVIEKDREEVKAEYTQFSRKWRTGAAIGKVSNGSGYSAGRAAGDRVNLGGNAKGSLPKGQEVLR